MAQKLRQGMPTDIVILTAALVAKLVEEKLVVASSIADVGLVETALAVRQRDPLVMVRDEADLRRALLAADAIFLPDTETSTAGIHVAKVLAQIGIADAIAPRLRIYPNGATAMRHLAASDAVRPIGCTQSTEIISTEGVVLSGALPVGYGLSTMYTAGVTTQAANPRQAQALINLLTSAGLARARRLSQRRKLAGRRPAQSALSHLSLPRTPYTNILVRSKYADTRHQKE